MSNDPVPDGLIDKIKEIVHKELDKKEGKA